MYPQEIRDRAIALYADLKSYRAAATQVSAEFNQEIAEQTVWRWVNPEAAKQHRQKYRKYQDAQRRERFETDPEYREWVLEQERMQDPEYRGQKQADAMERQRLQRLDRYQKKREQILTNLKVYRATPRGRCERALEHSRQHARTHGYVACIATVEQLLKAFTGCCKHCDRSEPGFKLYVDHNHATGDFRGWVCNRCNTMLGRFNDNVRQLKKWLKTQPPSVPREFIGVYPTPNGTFEATASRAGKELYVGTFPNALTAATARNAYILQHGLKSRLNVLECGRAAA
jgi:hypothetical protein